MFELLLQADRSLSEGLLDQAERTYWQLIELDPTNAIAVAGLARIALQRGDRRLARSFADQALDIDPDSIAARRVIQALDEGGTAPAGPNPPDLPLRGAEKLEALSRRRVNAPEGDEGDEGSSTTGDARGGARPKTASRSGTAARGATRSPGRQTRGGVPSDEFEPGPSEPLHERRRSGRLAAAAAAAAAAVHEPGHAHHEPHHAMPSGRRLFQPDTLKAPPSDPFSEAEMAAAAAAVDSLDETFEANVSSAAEVPTRSEADLEHALDAIDATEADESVALRIALLSGTAETSGPASEAVEADWTNADGSANADAAEAEAAAEAPREVADAPSAMRAEPNPPEPLGAGGPSERRPSEEEAEAQALREAMAIVLADDDQADETEGSAPPAGGEAAMEAVPADAVSTAATTGPVALAADEPTDAEASAQAAPDAEPAPPKKGLFRRFRGS